MSSEAEIFASRKMGKRGRLQIPKDVREYLELEPGVVVLFLKDSFGQVLLQKAPKLKKEQRIGKYR